MLFSSSVPRFQFAYRSVTGPLGSVVGSAVASGAVVASGALVGAAVASGAVVASGAWGFCGACVVADGVAHAADKLTVFLQPGVAHEETPEMHARVMDFFAHEL